LEVSITEMYPRIPWEMVVDPLRSPDHTFGNTELEELTQNYTYQVAADSFRLVSPFHTPRRPLGRVEV